MEIQGKILKPRRAHAGGTIAEVLVALVLLVSIIAMLSASLMTALSMGRYSQSHLRATQEALAAYYNYTDDTALINKNTDENRNISAGFTCGTLRFTLKFNVDTYEYTPEDQSEVVFHVFSK